MSEHSELVARLRNDHGDLSRIDLAADAIEELTAIIEAQARENAALTVKLEAAEAKVARLTGALKNLNAALRRDGSDEEMSVEVIGPMESLSILASALNAASETLAEIGGGNG